MLSMLRFCHVIKYHSMWHDNAVLCQGAKSTLKFRAQAISAGGKLAWPNNAEVKEVN